MANSLDAILDGDSAASNPTPQPSESPAPAAPAPPAPRAADTALPIRLWTPWRWLRLVSARELAAAAASATPSTSRLARIFRYAPIAFPAAVWLIAWFYRPFVLTGPDVCGLRRNTGIPCPTCGLTRSFCFMAHGEFATAWGFNSLGPILFVVMVFALLFALTRELKWVGLEFRQPRHFWWAVLLVFLGLYAVRMYIFFTTSEHLEEMSPTTLGNLLLFH